MPRRNRKPTTQQAGDFYWLLKELRIEWAERNIARRFHRNITTTGEHE